jgi:hypothetical protein
MWRIMGTIKSKMIYSEKKKMKKKKKRKTFGLLQIQPQQGGV